MTLVLECLDLEEAERLICLEALRVAGSIVEAATMLGITRHALKRRITKHGIQWPPVFGQNATLPVEKIARAQSPANESRGGYPLGPRPDAATGQMNYPPTVHYNGYVPMAAVGNAQPVVYRPQYVGATGPSLMNHPYPPLPYPTLRGTDRNDT